MAALRASLEASKPGQRRPSRASRSSNGAGSNGASSEDLEDMTKGELEKRAKKAEIEGRSKMSKEELIKALRAAA